MIISNDYNYKLAFSLDDSLVELESLFINYYGYYNEGETSETFRLVPRLRNIINADFLEEIKIKKTKGKYVARCSEVALAKLIHAMGYSSSWRFKRWIFNRLDEVADRLGIDPEGSECYFVNGQFFVTLFAKDETIGTLMAIEYPEARLEVEN